MSITLPVGPSSPIPQCGNCHYARTDHEGDLNCHRNPPAVFLEPTPGGDYRVVTAFPLMQPDKWCGEWCPRGAPTNG